MRRTRQKLAYKNTRTIYTAFCLFFDRKTGKERGGGKSVCYKEMGSLWILLFFVLFFLVGFLKDFILARL